MSNVLTVKHLCMRFGGLKALEDVSFNVPPNTITALIGPNGAGKTTLFNCLTGFYRFTSGEIIYTREGHPLSISNLLGQSFDFSQLAHPKALASCLYSKLFGGSHLVTKAGIARTFQNIRLFKEMSVVENLLVAQHLYVDRHLLTGLLNTKRFRQQESDAIDTAYQWLEKFHLQDDANRLAGELPYGKQRHLEIARAMCTQPSLLCLDEPAAGLNPHETQELKTIILSLRDTNMTLILIEHDMSLVMSLSDNVIVLDHGEVISQGTPLEVQNDQRVIDAYLGVEHDE